MIFMILANVLEISAAALAHYSPPANRSISPPLELLNACIALISYIVLAAFVRILEIRNKRGKCARIYNKI